MKGIIFSVTFVLLVNREKCIDLIYSLLTLLLEINWFNVIYGLLSIILGLILILPAGMINGYAYNQEDSQNKSTAFTLVIFLPITGIITIITGKHWFVSVNWLFLMMTLYFDIQIHKKLKLERENNIKEV